MNRVHNNKLMQFSTNISEHDIVNEFALGQTGYAGLFVKIAANGPDATDTAGITAASVGATYDRVTSPQWGTKALLTPIASGDLAFQVLGVTQKNVLTVDENGEQLKYRPQKKQELNAVLTYESVPVAMRGIFTLGVDAFLVNGATATTGNLPDAGSVLVAANGGKVNVITGSGALAVDNKLVLGCVLQKSVKQNGMIVVRVGK